MKTYDWATPARIEIGNLSIALSDMRDDLAKVTAQRNLLLALLKRTAKILVELDNFYPDAMPDDIDDLIIGAADAIALAVTGDE